MGWPGKLIFAGYRRLLSHPRYGFWVALLSIAYLISPFDLLPDLIPGLGQVDDLALLMLMGTAIVQGVMASLTPGKEDAPQKTPPQTYDGGATIDVKARPLDRS